MGGAVLNDALIAVKAGDITVYNYDNGTQEYISTSTEYLAVGVGIPGMFLFRCTVHIKRVMQFAAQRI